MLGRNTGSTWFFCQSEYLPNLVYVYKKFNMLIMLPKIFSEKLTKPVLNFTSYNINKKSNLGKIYGCFY